MLWTALNHLKNEQGIELDFRDHLYLFDIFNDLSPKQVILKAAQIGLSTTTILKVLWVSKFLGMDIVYTLPTMADVYDFAGGKVNRIIAQNPVLQQMTKDRDTVEQKQVGKNIVYWRGTFSQKQATMVSADLLVHDELDASKADVVAQYGTRLQHSKHKWEWVFSHPSVQGYGVDIQWQKSDQKHWFITCDCGKEQYLSWPESFDMARKIYICKACGKELTKEERRVGKWKAKYPGREWSGYWVPLMVCPWISAAEIIKYFQEKPKDYFWNKVLGLPYVGDDNQVTASTIQQNLTNIPYTVDQVVIGCDSGIKKHYVVGNRNGIFNKGVATQWEEVEGILRMYDRSVLVIDALPDITAPRALMEKYPGRVFLAHYAKDRKTMQLIRWGSGDELGNVVIDRNRVIQLVVDEFADRKIRVHGDAQEWQPYVNHWLNIYKVTEENALGQPEFRWEKKNTEDHWVHATVYWRAGVDRVGIGSAQFVSAETENHAQEAVEFIDVWGT